MKALKLSTMLLGIALFLGLSASTLSAEMKCGAGKCGKAMKMDKKAKGCACKNCDNNKCAAKLDPNAKCDCNHTKPTMKCAAGKCGKK
jgi:hypothetical protein